VPVTRRSRTLAASAEAIWRVLDDPHQQPRWWPGLRRVEAVSDDRFTQVLLTPKGRPVRVDMRVAARDPGRALTWEQELAGTPFERHLQESLTSFTLAAGGGGTEVSIEHRVRLRGASRAGGWMLRRATAARLDAALAQLAEILG
jgi:uncharacterized protein YndB with AHSA1/START domain